MIKWIGQHIFDFIARFRDDVYLEDIADGTVANDKFLGLDSNNKIVKETVSTGTVDLTSGVTGTLPVGNGGTGATTLTSNSILTGNGTSAVQAEAGLTYDSEILNIGDDDNGVATIKRATHSDGDGGDIYVRGGDATSGQTNKAGGGVRLYAGRSTGNESGGNIGIFGVPSGSSGTSLNSVDTTQAIAVFKSDGKTTTLGGNLIFEGPTPDANETTFSITDPTADRTITVPDASGTMAFLDSDITGNAATSTALTSGDKTIEGNLRIGGSGDTSNNWITIDAQNGTDTTGGGICFYETGTDTIGAPANGAKIVYNEDDDEFAIGTMHGGTFKRQIHMDRGSSTVVMKNASISTTSTDGPFIQFINEDTSIANGQSIARILCRNEDRAAITSRINWVATEDHDSDSGGTKIDFIITPNGNSQSETTAVTIGQDSSLTVGGAITSGGNTVATTNLALDSFADSTSNAVGVGTIELGHASDTTIARAAAGIVTIENELVVTTKNPLLASSGSTNQTIATYHSRRTLTTAEMNDLHNTPIQIAPAGGSNVVIIPTGGFIRVDRASTNSGSGSLDFHYNGVTGAYGTTSLVHIRRFHASRATDGVYNIVPNSGGVLTSTNLTDHVNSAMEVSLTSACTTDCFTSVDIFLTYQKITIA